MAEVHNLLLLFDVILELVGVGVGFVHLHCKLFSMIKSNANTSEELFF